MKAQEKWREQVHMKKHFHTPTPTPTESIRYINPQNTLENLDSKDI